VSRQKTIGRLGRLLGALCAVFAAAGGLLIALLALLTVISVGGRFLFAAPIPGDFELVEMGCAVAVFAFLPYGQWTRGNVKVDFFTQRIGSRWRARFDAAGSLLYALAAAVLAWRMSHGGLEFYRYGEQTMILGMPRWWAFVPIVPTLVLLSVVCLYTAWRSLIEAASD